MCSYISCFIVTTIENIVEIGGGEGLTNCGVFFFFSFSFQLRQIDKDRSSFVFTDFFWRWQDNNMNEERRRLIERSRRNSFKIEKPRHSNLKFPKLSGLQLPGLKFPGFPDYKIIECPDFNTSAESEDEDRKETSILDRLRVEDGGLDLGIHKSNFGIQRGEIEKTKTTRKLINYDGYKGEIPAIEEEKPTAVRKEEKYEVPFEFGDRGSRWRMMKLDKLGVDPRKEDIFEQYATLWDYQLACLEREELKKRKWKAEEDWDFKPSDEFIASREGHLLANKLAMKDISSGKGGVRDGENVSGEDNVVEMKRYDNVRSSRNKRLKNELKLAHLTSMDNEFEDFTISRDQIESLTND